MSTLKRIPGYSRYGITDDGKIFNLVTGKRLRTSADLRGYHRTVLVNDEGIRKTVKRHRLVALAHLEWPEGNIEDFVVNHKDSTPGNDWADNLEWCTQRENVLHGIASGTERRIIPLEVLDVNTGKLTRYNSIAECSKDVGIDRYAIHLRLERGPEFIWPEGRRYREGHSDAPWPEVKELDYGRSREVILRDLRRDKQIIFEKLSDALPIIGCAMSTVWHWANDPAQPVIPGLYQIQFLDSVKPWREVEDFFEELQKTTGKKVTFVFDEDWGNPVWYASANDCAAANGLKPTALNYRLKSKGQKVFSDGKRYCYYDDLSEVQKKTIRYEVPQEGCVQRPSKATSVRDQLLRQINDTRVKPGGCV